MGGTWKVPQVALDMETTENGVPWVVPVVVGGVALAAGGMVYCDLHHGKSFGFSAQWDGWRPTNVRMGCG